MAQDEIFDETFPEEEPNDEPALGGKLVPLDGGALKVPGVKEALAKAQQRDNVTMALLAFGISRTSPADWADMQGKPHPMNRAVISMLKNVGITASLTNIETVRRDDGHYVKRVTGWAQQEGFPPIGVLGKAFSADSFFTTRYIKNDDGSKTQITLPASEVQEDDVEAKAVTNFYYRALCAVLGIKGLTWKDLEPLGITPNRAAARIQYGEGKPATQTSPQTGNCPTCGKGNLVERIRKSDSSKFYACDNSRFDKAANKYVGCNHMQNEPPAAKQAEPPKQAPASDSSDSKTDAVNSLIEHMKKQYDMGPTALWREISASLSKEVKGPADVTAEEIAQFREQYDKAMRSPAQGNDPFCNE